MDNTSGVGVLDKAAHRPQRARGRPVDPRAARDRHRPGPPDGPPAGRGAGAPPAGHPRHAGPVRPRPAAGRARRRGRRGPPARGRRAGARRPARPHQRERPALPPPGRAPGLRRRPPSAPSACATRSRSARRCRCAPGSAAQVLLAWEEPDRLHRGLQGAAFTATALSGVRRRGWAQSVGEREPGVASVSAPVRGPSGRVIAAVSISGPDRAAVAPARPAARRHRDRRRQQAHRGARPPRGAAGRPEQRLTPLPDFLRISHASGRRQADCPRPRGRSARSGPDATRMSHGARLDATPAGQISTTTPVVPREEVAHVCQPRPTHRP